MENDLLHRKERLILTTIEIIEELGIQGLTTREIAKRENVSEATLFRHFKNKNELLQAVLYYYIQYDSDLYQSIRLHEMEPLDAIRFVMREFSEYYENYPAITAITQLYDVLRYDPELTIQVQKILTSRVSAIKLLIDNAKNNGTLSKDLDSEAVAMILLGTFREVCLNWRLAHYSYSLKEKIKVSIDIILDAL